MPHKCHALGLVPGLYLSQSDKFEFWCTTIMTLETTDEETPLLHANDYVEPQQKPVITGKTPLPWSQFSIILSLQVLEPMTSQVISPFAPQVGTCCIALEQLMMERRPADTKHWSNQR